MKLIVLSYWERMAGAVIAFSEILLLSQYLDFELFAPLVNHSELGAFIHPAQSNILEANNFETYFDLKTIKNGTIDLLPHSSYSTLNTLCNIFHVIDYENNNCIRSKNHYRFSSDIVIKCIPYHYFQAKPKEKIIQSFKSMLETGAQFCNDTFILYEWHKIQSPLYTLPIQKLVWGGLSDQVKKYSQLIVTQLFGENARYHSIQFRGGYFYRGIRLNKTLSEDDQLMASVKDIFQAVPEGTKNIYFATDMYLTIPEGGGKAGSSRSTVLEAAMRYAYHSTGYNVRTLQNASIPTSSSIDSFTLAALVDAQVVMTSPTVTVLSANSAYANILCVMNNAHYNGSCVFHRAHGEW